MEIPSAILADPTLALLWRRLEHVATVQAELLHRISKLEDRLPELAGWLEQVLAVLEDQRRSAP